MVPRNQNASNEHEDIRNGYVTCADGYMAAMKRLLDDWEWDAILPCHGHFIESGGKQTLRRHLGL